MEELQEQRKNAKQREQSQEHLKWELNRMMGSGVFKQ
jgi:hypothetical protein